MIPFDTRLNNFIGAVAFAADEEMQRSVFIDKVSGLTSITSVGEFYCQFFDDNDMDGFFEKEITSAPPKFCAKSGNPPISCGVGTN